MDIMRLGKQDTLALYSLVFGFTVLKPDLLNSKCRLVLNHHKHMRLGTCHKRIMNNRMPGWIVRSDITKRGSYFGLADCLPNCKVLGKPECNAKLV